MAKEDEPVYRFVLHAKGKKVRDVIQYMAEQVEGLDIIESGVLGSEVKESGQTWEQELAELSGLIEKTQEEVSINNPVTIAGFRSMLREKGEFLTRNNVHYSDIFQFSDSVMDIFKQSYEQYAARAERPTPKGKRANAYLRIGNYLTPREIRLIIRGKGLTGEMIPAELAVEMDGLKVDNRFGASRAINMAQQKLIYALIPQDQNHPLFRAGYNKRYTNR